MLFYYLRRNKSRARRRAVQGVEKLFLKRKINNKKKKKSLYLKINDFIFLAQKYRKYLYSGENFPNKTFPI